MEVPNDIWKLDHVIYSKGETLYLLAIKLEYNELEEGDQALFRTTARHIKQLIVLSDYIPHDYKRKMVAQIEDDEKVFMRACKTKK